MTSHGGPTSGAAPESPRVGRAIGLGIVGCGDLAQNGVLPHLAQPDALAAARVAAICGRSLERAQTLAQRYHIPHVTSEYEKMLGDPAVEAVLVLTPARLHFTQALAAIRAGKHVYVQKPLTETLQEALTLEREVARHGVRLVAAPGQALNPLVPRLREMIKEVISAHRSGSMPRRRRGVGGMFRFPRTQPGTSAREPAHSGIWRSMRSIC